MKTKLLECNLIVAVLSIHESFFNGLDDSTEITVNYGRNYVKTRAEWLQDYQNANAGLSKQELENYDIDELRECICADCRTAYPRRIKVDPIRRMQRMCMLKLGRDH